MTYMRITTKLLNDNVINNLFTNRSKLNDLNEQLSTGKRISKPSDDPNAAINILSAKTSLEQIERYSTNIDNAQSELDITDESILSAVDVVQRAKTLATEAANATNGSTELDAINSEIKQLIQQIKDIANTKFGSKYIFGGLVTEEPPYTEAANGDIVYNGTSSTSNYQRKAEISENITIDTNIAGDSIFGQYVAGDSTRQTGLLNTLVNLSTSLENADFDNIRASLDEFDDDLDTLLNTQATIGGTLSRLEMTKSKLEDDNVTFTKFRSNSEDIDMAKVISDIQYQETALEASLQVGANAVQSSLLDYM
jgi:flagellar hook-associated protein 3 FlgL